MQQFIITWNAGYGETHEVITAEDYDKAVELAYEKWRVEAEANADYSAVVYTDELAEGLDL